MRTRCHRGRVPYNELLLVLHTELGHALVITRIADELTPTLQLDGSHLSSNVLATTQVKMLISIQSLKSNDVMWSNHELANHELAMT